jgi:YVTN family beta-propeller protein
VGKVPRDIAINERTHTVYVVNAHSNSVSVINGTTHKKIGSDITVGKVPRGISINESTNAVYVTNRASNTISVIDGISNRVIAGVKFQISPFNSGNIECDGLSSLLSQYFYIYSGTNCIAKPYQGFEFVSWERNLNGTSSQVINVSRPASFLDSIADFLYVKSDEQEAILNVTEFGSFTATFKELPPPLPPEYWATLFGVVVTAFISSWLSPTIIGWRKAKKHQNKLNNYQNELKDLYKDNKLDKKDISKLNKLRENIVSAYTRGDLTKDQYDVLLKNLSIKYNEIFKNKINSLKNILSNEDNLKLMDDLEAELDDAYLEEKIDKEHYALFKDKIIELKKGNNSNKE